VKSLERFVEPTFALFRVVLGFLFACHGAQKLFGVLGFQKVAGARMLVAGVVEFGGGILIAFGLFTAVAAFIACGEMALAYFTSHAPQGFWPIRNHGELAVLYCFAFLFIAAHRAGRWSLDALLRKRA
jgi:putative oxidoreductase